jgi:hypothetical protein
MKKALPAPPPRVQSPKEAQRPLPVPGLKALPPPEKEDESVTRSRAVAEPSVQALAVGKPMQIMKAAASPRAPADQPKGAKAPPPKKGQESPETKVSHPMATRKKRQASGAGGLRGVVRSGSTGYVCDKSSPSSKPGS